MGRPNKCRIFSHAAGQARNLSRIVIEGSRGLGKRLERQDEGSWTDLKNLRESCSRRSARLGMAACDE